MTGILRSLPMTLLTVVLLAGTLVPGSALACDGTGCGGGDPYAAQFAAIGRRISDSFFEICQGPKGQARLAADGHLELGICQDSGKFTSALEAHVIPVKELTGSNGSFREAGPSNPDCKPRDVGTGDCDILLGRSQFKSDLKRPDAPEGIIPLVAHEYMIACGLEKNDDYTRSSQLVALLSEEQRKDPGLFRRLLGNTPVYACLVTCGTPLIVRKGFEVSLDSLQGCSEKDKTFSYTAGPPLPGYDLDEREVTIGIQSSSGRWILKKTFEPDDDHYMIYHRSEKPDQLSYQCEYQDDLANPTWFPAALSAHSYAISGYIVPDLQNRVAVGEEKDAKTAKSVPHDEQGSTKPPAGASGEQRPTQ